ncbi:HEAT repeat domain-containing protein [Leptolyngbya sp. CCNP1308]|uniref:HEAT repeat domain-containing protein n=1 Tax=Leptolyngbya sp. CCNP1308 TaxID=3110255 RepID=UPI002B2187E6|nr:HEAT repeat domain-containing protein [Leptolyngbya sp. CCNP1308]MEA5452773.1 HEAT repeat domain-containing protein [Leptolyngbya sp. CCNP1308]
MSLSGPAKEIQSLRGRFLDLINLRPGEEERTLLMFAFYTATSMGILWLEVSSAALFLGQYGAASLPWIYIFSAGVGLGLSVVYSWLQRLFPLRRVIVIIAMLMAVPILGFRWGLTIPWLAAPMVFSMRLWIEAIYGLNDLNLSVTANQLFNIREIKRAYPIISSGNLVADVISGFSVYLLLKLIGLQNVLLLSFVVMVVGAAILYHLSRNYEHAFPDSPRRQAEDAESVESFRSRQRLQGPIRQYVVLLFSFFVLAQMLLFSIEFQFFNQLETSLDVDAIAAFLGFFSGLLGLIELFTQWFTSSRLIEREGVFTVALVLPSVIVVIGVITLVASYPVRMGLMAMFVGLIVLKFFDEWLRYTLVATTRPILFQPIPDQVRSTVQSWVGGIAEPLSMGGTGVAILVTIAVCNRIGLVDTLVQARLFLLGTVVAALVWFAIMVLLRSRYLNLLVRGAERGLLTFSDANLRVLKRAFIEQLEKPGLDANKRSCIELLSHIDPKNVGEILAPRLADLPPALQRQSLEAMLEHPNPAYTDQVQTLLEVPHQAPEILALALRYVWLAQERFDINDLRPYLPPEVDAVVRGTAASLMLRRGNLQERAEATATLRKMLVHDEERERVMGCRALGEADYMESLSIYIDDLLQDPSLRVRRAILEAIAATQYKKYYPSLLKALQYKSTREAAVAALTRLGNEALPMLQELALDSYRPEILRNQAWQVIGNIGTVPALEFLIQNLITTWGSTRRHILRILLSLYQEVGVKRSVLIDGALDRMLGRSGIEDLLNTELAFAGQMLAAKVDLAANRVAGTEADLLREALDGLQADATERLFMLLRFVSPATAIQAAQVSLSGSAAQWARGIEILDNVVDVANKRSILILLDRRLDADKLKLLALSTPLIPYGAMLPRDRLRQLLDLRNFLSDWAVACCFHLARVQRWNLTAEHTLASLQHPTGFVREAVLAYLAVASPRALRELLPLMQQDTDPLVLAQVKQLLNTYNLEPSPSAG